MAEIILAENAGFCFGVNAAVNTCRKELVKAGKDKVPLYCLGELIHNREMIKELEEEGLVIIHSLDQVPDYSRVLIRAHGEPASVYKAAAVKNIALIDATCPFVARIHQLAGDAEKKGSRIIVIGDREHPEVKGILGSSDLSLGAADNPKEAAYLAEKDSHITVVAQTTITEEKFASCCRAILAKRPDAVIENTICLATRKRLEGAEKLAEKSDCMVVIGDKSSSNSLKLKSACESVCKNVYFVENLSNLPLQELQKYNKIGVAASASAPERIIKEVLVSMSELFTANNGEITSMEDVMKVVDSNQSLKLPQRGETVNGSVVQVTGDYVVVNLGCKKDGILLKEEVVLEEGQELTDAFTEGDEVQAKVIKTDDGEGNILLSKKKLQSGENWTEIIEAFENKEVINVAVVKEVKGGVIASYKEVSGFIPMSQLADHYVENAAEFIGRTLPVKVTRVDQKKNKAVFSHKAFLAEEKGKKIAEIWDNLSVGDVVEGKVMRFTDYGAFVDIGGIDGLLHISEISWGKLKHPKEALEIGQLVNVKILSMNVEKGKISLGLKQNAPEPWTVIDESYHVGDVIRGKVVQIKEYGAFIELAPGLDGLVHISEIAHKRVNKVADELSVHQEVEAKILEIDKERKRISLSIKDTIEAPAEAAAPAEAPEQEEEVPTQEE